MKKVVAVLDSMYAWRGLTYGEAPKFFTISPHNFSGKRLYRIVGRDARLLVTNSCKEIGAHANHHGKPDPEWLATNLVVVKPFDLLLICGRVARETYARTGHKFKHTLFFPHPAARTWTNAALDNAARQCAEVLQ